MPQKSISEIYAEATTPITLEEEKFKKEQEHKASQEIFFAQQKAQEHRIWLELQQTKDFLQELDKQIKHLENGFKQFSDNVMNEDMLKSAGIHAIKLSVKLTQLTKIINYARTNNTSELH